MRLTFLTVGEYPATNGLHASQLLPLATSLVERGATVQWIAYVPFEAWLKDRLTGRDRLGAVAALTASNTIDFHVVPFPITLDRLHSYLFRDRLTALAGKKLGRLLTRFCHEDGRHIVYCRSYFATAVALAAKRHCPGIEVSFDMRSLLPPEIPLIFPRVGRYLYGSLKDWEQRLLAESEYAFLQTSRGVDLLRLEGARAPQYMPLMGFDAPAVAAGDTDDVPLVGYIGGFGPWQSAQLLRTIFKQLSAALPGLRMEVLTTSPVQFPDGVLVRSVPNHEVAASIVAMSAVVVPGPAKRSGYFNTLQTCSNLFSTKAAEALSLGVPLIVNVALTELADFVVKHRCGILFEEAEDGIRFKDGGDRLLSDEQFRKQLRKAAAEVAGRFRRSAVIQRYLQAWGVEDTLQ